MCYVHNQWYDISCATLCVCNIEDTSCKLCCSGKAMTIKYFVCVFVALDIQYAKRMCHILLSSMACRVVPYFSTLFPKRRHFRGKKCITRKMLFDFFLQILFKLSPF